jgi:hypothetical protein
MGHRVSRLHPDHTLTTPQGPVNPTTPTTPPPLYIAGVQGVVDSALGDEHYTPLSKAASDAA